MMGTLATVLAKKKIRTFNDRYKATVTGDIEAVEGVLKITRIKVHYVLKVEPEKQTDVRQAMGEYLVKCPGAMSVIGCIDLTDEMTMEAP
jgi:organic hydroperoxide reductase OsmC/OhrA